MPLFVWLGNKLKSQVDRAIDAKMDAAGKAAVAEARRVVHVRTGRLKASIGYSYRQSDRTLTLHADEPYALFEEMGTRYRPPHPYLRPGLAAAGRVWGMKTELQFTNVPASRTPARSARHRSMLASNAKFNAGVDRKLGRSRPTVVFHGDNPGSRLGFAVPYRHATRFRQR